MGRPPVEEERLRLFRSGSASARRCRHAFQQAIEIGPGEELPANYYGRDLSGIANVRQRIRVEQYEVRRLASFDCAGRIDATKKFGAISRSRPQRLEGVKIRSYKAA